MKAFVYVGTVLLLAWLPMCSSPGGGSSTSCPQGMTCGGAEGGSDDGAGADAMGGGDGGTGGDAGNADGDGGTSLDGIVPPDRIEEVVSEHVADIAALPIAHHDAAGVVDDVVFDEVPVRVHVEVEAFGVRAATGGFYEGPQVSNYDDGAGTGVQTIYEFGFPNMGNTDFSGMLQAAMPIDYSSEGSTLATSQQLDLNVAATVLRHGNYDYFHRAIVWDPMIAQHAMPDSLVHAAKPAWFGKLAWPPLDPASPPGAFGNATLATIPAGYRYVNRVDP